MGQPHVPSLGRQEWLRLEPMVLLAILCFMPLAIYAVGNPLLVVIAGVGTGALVAGAFSARWAPTVASARRVLSAAIALAFVGLSLLVVADFYLATLFAPQFLIPALVATATTVAACLVGLDADVTTTKRWAVTVLLLSTLLASGFSYLVNVAETNLDVFVLHQSATDALSHGRNPYVEAAAVDSSPLAPDGAVIRGYTYPPTTLLAYAAFGLTTGDPRWAAVVAIGLTVLLLVAPWRAWDPRIEPLRLVLPLLLVVAPGAGIVTFFGWTEPLALPFFVLAARFWRSNIVVSAIALGFALSTKQYFVLAVPLLLFWPDKDRWKRFFIVGAVVALTVLPFVLADAGALYRALFGNTAFSAAPRADSTNLVHLGVVLPRWLALAAAGGLAYWFGKRGGDGARFVLALAAVLAVAFFLGVAAFRNYWFLLGAMAVVAIAEQYTEDSAVAQREAVSVPP